MGRARWKITAAVVAVALVGGLSACDWTPRPSFTVSSTGTGADVAPGDGVCETAAGNGVCTLAAAVDEANALGVDTDLVVPTGDYQAVNVLVTGKLRINEGLANPIAVGSVTVAAGGQLIIDGLAQFLAPGPSYAVQVDGVLVMRHSSLSGPTTQLRVGATGVAALENVMIDGAFTSLVVNDGFLALRNVTISMLDVVAATGLDTGATGTTQLESTMIVRRSASGVPSGGTVVACFGTAPVSLGANLALDTSCGLSAPDDQQGTNVGATWSSTAAVPYVVTLTPDPGTAAVDAIAEGSHGCGDAVVDDQVGNGRPIDADGDPDTPAACDIGAIERTGF